MIALMIANAIKIFYYKLKIYKPIDKLLFIFYINKVILLIGCSDKVNLDNSSPSFRIFYFLVIQEVAILFFLRDSRLIANQCLCMRVTEPYIIFPRVLKSGKIVYYYQFRYENGKRSPAYSCGTTNLAQAKRICQKLYNEGKFKINNELTFKSFATGFFDTNSEFLEWKKINKNNLSPSTIQSYKQLLNNHLMPYFCNMKLNKITTDTIKLWIIDTQKTLSAKTSNNAQSVLNIILKSAKEKKIISENPCADLSFRKVSKKNRELLNTNELHKIYLSDEWKWDSAKNAFLVCAITGMRIGEVTGLQTTEVEADRLNVRHSLHPTFGLGQTKTRVCRYVPIPPILKLKDKCGSKWAFQNPYSEVPIRAGFIYDKLIKICETLGIDTKARGITVHSLRNSFISYMRGSSFGETIDLKIKAVVGHADETMTDWYTYWTPKMFPEIYEIQEQLYHQITGD